MASSGTISGSTNYSAGGSMVVLFVRALWLQTPDAANNRSTVRVEFQARQSRGAYFEAPATWVVKIDWAAVAAPGGSLKARQDGSWTTCWVAEYVVNHDSEGRKTLTLSVEGAYQIGSWSDTARCPVSGAASITLDPIEAGGGGDTPAAAVISSITSRLLLDGSQQMTIQIAKPTGTQYCAAVVSIGTVASDPIPMDGATNTATFTPPASWADQIPDSAQRTDGTVRVTTYSDAAHTTPVGSAVGRWTGYGRFEIATMSGSVSLGDALSVAVRRPGGAQYCAAVVKLGQRSATIDLDGVTSGSITIPESWGDQFPAATSMAGTVEVVTYTSAAHEDQVAIVVGSWTCAAPASMGPQLPGGVLWLESGTIEDTGGTPIYQANQVRSGVLSLPAGQYTAVVGGSLQMWLEVYSETGAYLPGECSTAWSAQGHMSFTLSGTRRVIIVFARPDRAAMTPSEVSGFSITSGGTTSLCWARAWPWSANSVVDGWGVGVETHSAVRINVKGGEVITHGGATVDRVIMYLNGEIITDVGHVLNVWEGISPVIQDAAHADVYIQVYDSRGYMAQAPVYPVIRDYIAPRLSDIAVFRADSAGDASEDGGYISVRATASVTAIYSLNSSTLRARYKSASSSWSAWTTLTSGTATLLGGGQFLPETAYAVQIEVTDATGATATYQDTVPSKAAMLHLLAGNLGMGLGKYSQKGSGWIDSAFSIHTDQDVEVGRNLTFTTPAHIPYPALGGEGIEIPSGTDLNTLTAIGNYYHPTDSTVSTLVNKPATLNTSFVMRVFAGAGPNWRTWVVQEIITWGNGRMWRRHVTPQEAGTWYKYDTTAD